jgi:phage-related protein
MIGLSLAVLILSGAMTKLAKLDWGGVARGLTSVAALSLILVGSAKILSTGTKGLIRSSVGLTIFAAAINILTTAVTKLGSLDIASLAKGLIGVGVLVTELALFMNLTDFSGMGVGKGLGLLALAAGLDVLAIAVKKLSEIDLLALVKGLGGMAVILGEIALFINVTGDAKRVISTAIGLTILGGALIIFATAIEKMGALPIDQIGRGLLAMGGSLALVVGALILMPKNIIGQSVGLVLMASALVILSKALSTMGGMSWEEIAKGLVTLAGSLTIISVSMLLMKTALPGAAALIIIAGALAILAPVLKSLGEMSWTEIGRGLLALVGIFAVVGIAALALGPVVPIILALSGAIALFGLGCLAVGAGILAFSAGLTALSVAGSAGAAALTLIVTSIVGLIPYTLQKLAQGIIDFSKTIGDGAPVICESMKKILLSIIETINTIAPQIMNCIVTLLKSWLNTLVETVPMMVDAGMKLILGLLQGVADNIQKVVETGIEVILNFIKGVISKLPDIIDTAFKVIISFINGLADAIRNNSDAIFDACANLVDAIIDAITSFIPKLIGVGENIVNGLIDGIKGMGRALWDAAQSVVANAVDGIKNLLGIHSPSKVFAEIGRYSVEGFVNGLNQFAGLAADEAESLGNTAINSLRNTISNIADAVSGKIDVQPTIRPVLDLSAVTDGAGTISSLLNKSSGIVVGTANNKLSSINPNALRDNSIQNGSNGQTTNKGIGDVKAPAKPLALQLILQNGRVIAEYIIDDVDALLGNRNVVAGRSNGL